MDVAKQIALREIVEQRKKKDLAEIDKAKELAIAEANRNIQKANTEAAKFEAMAIRETGIAQAEVQRDIANVLYTNLRNFTVDIPDNYVQTGDADGASSLKTNLDIITAFGALQMMDKAKKLTPGEMNKANVGERARRAWARGSKAGKTELE